MININMTDTNTSTNVIKETSYYFNNVNMSSSIDDILTKYGVNSNISIEWKLNIDNGEKNDG